MSFVDNSNRIEREVYLWGQMNGGTADATGGGVLTDVGGDLRRSVFYMTDFERRSELAVWGSVV